LDDEVITPNIDRLARNGTTFTHAYNMGAWNGAVCVASRAMLITGSYIWDAYRYEDEYRNQDEPLSRPMWGNIMQQAGVSMPGSVACLPVYHSVCWITRVV
jgi:arylsulfatase A-like enzyme